MVWMYNPKTYAVVTVQASGHLPPEMAIEIVNRLGLLDKIMSLIKQHEEDESP